MMSYGMVWFGEGWQSWHTSPLFGETPSAPSSISNTTQALHTAGVPYEKIGIGVGFYSTPYENGSWQGGAFVHAKSRMTTSSRSPRKDRMPERTDWAA